MPDRSTSLSVSSGDSLPRLPVEVPEAVVQNGSEQHPSDVRQHESPSQFVDAVEDESRYDDEHPRQADFHERPAELLCAKENRRPKPVEKQLDGVESKRNPDFTEATAFVPNPERSVAHRQVEKRPHREEKLKTKPT